MTEPTDATVIAFPGRSGRQVRTVSLPPDPSAALFEMPLRTAPMLQPQPKQPPKSKPRRPKPAPPKPSRPALRTANSDDELCEGMKRTRRVRVTFDADVHSATFYDGRLTIVLELPTGERLPICPEDIGAVIEVIERDGA